MVNGGLINEEETMKKEKKKVTKILWNNHKLSIFAMFHSSYKSR